MSRAIVSRAVVSRAIVSRAIVSRAIVSRAIVSRAIVSRAIVSSAVVSVRHLPPQVRDLIGPNPVLLLGTKADLLPRGTEQVCYLNPSPNLSPHPMTP